LHCCDACLIHVPDVGTVKVVICYCLGQITEKETFALLNDVALERLVACGLLIESLGFRFRKVLNQSGPAIFLLSQVVGC
jgi:hypothetical protein